MPSQIFLLLCSLTLNNSIHYFIHSAKDYTPVSVGIH